MQTPTLQQARSQYEAQRRVSLGALRALRRLFARTPTPTIPQIAATAAAYQAASASLASSTVAGYAGSQAPMTSAQAFMGVSSLGFSLTEPIIATIDRVVAAPVEALPAPWWEDAQKFMADLERLIVSEVADAGRSASQVEATGHGWTEYIRMLNPPSCARCTILAGKVYRWNQGFARHPLCDCVHVPVSNEAAAKAEGLIADPMQAFDKGLVRGLSQADAQAVTDGADITTVVNARRGTSQPGITNAVTTSLFGRKVKATTYGTTKRAAWRKANPTRLVRLRPESIYRFATSREDAIRLLRLYGYIT